MSRLFTFQVTMDVEVDDDKSEDDAFEIVQDMWKLAKEKYGTYTITYFEVDSSEEIET